MTDFNKTMLHKRYTTVEDWKAGVLAAYPGLTEKFVEDASGIHVVLHGDTEPIATWINSCNLGIVSKEPR